jgi:dTDP-4-dehydrorhamnose 3,5-epimerase
MRFEPLQIAGAVLVDIEPRHDARGFFARTFCAQEFRAQGLPSLMVQASVSYNPQRGTVRGLHFQWPPSREDKLVRCVRGRLFDVLVDLRPGSNAYMQHCSVQLDAEVRNAVFIPRGVAHGFQTLVDHTEVMYQMTDYHAPALAAVVRWNDPAFGIRWPLPLTSISDRDAGCGDFDRPTYEAEFARRQESPATA